MTSFNPMRSHGRPLVVENDLLGILIDQKIEQSSLVALEDTTVTITFTSANPYPKTSSIVVEVPHVLPEGSIGDPCWIEVVGVIAKSEDSCFFARNDVYKITFNNVLATMSTSVLPKGSTFRISFSTQNPEDNKFVKKDPYEITVYDSFDRSKAYGIDGSKGLENKLYHRLTCDYPCWRCSGTNPADCTACWEGKPDRYPHRFLYLDDATGVQTCKTVCPDGYSNSKARPRKCRRCDDYCLTCEQKGDHEETLGDYKLCVDCKPEYPFFLEET